MIVRVLGSAAGGGVPQWNCACKNCANARAGRIPRRSQSSFAVSGDGVSWWLVNISPDVAQQIEAHPPLQPGAKRSTPIAGMLLTDANVDHLGGLAVVRQAGTHAFTLWSSGVVRELATQQVAFAAFAREPHDWNVFAPGQDVRLDEHLTLRATPLAGTTPGYAGREATPGAVCGLSLRDERGKRVVFAPIFGAVDEALRGLVSEADVAFIDGSFYADDELAAHDGPGKKAVDLGHMPAGGAAGSLDALEPMARSTRLVYAHLNNTNPLADPASPQAHDAVRRGFEIAYDGLVLEV